MPMQIEDSGGQQIQVYTVDEVKEKEDALTKANADLVALNAEIAKLSNKDLNFANLRAQKEALDGEIGKLRTELDTKINAAKNEVLDGVMKDHYNEVIKSLAGNDVDLKAKIEREYARLNDPTATKEAISKKLSDAYFQATRPPEQTFGGSAAFSSGGVGAVGVKTDKKFTNEEKELANKLAQAGGMTLKDEDFNK